MDKLQATMTFVRVVESGSFFACPVSPHDRQMAVRIENAATIAGLTRRRAGDTYRRLGVALVSADVDTGLAESS